MNNSHWGVKSIDSNNIFACINANNPVDFDKRLKKAIEDEYGWEDIKFLKPNIREQLMKINSIVDFKFSLTKDDEPEYIELTLYPIWEY